MRIRKWKKILDKIYKVTGQLTTPQTESAIKWTKSWIVWFDPLVALMLFKI